MVRIIGPRSGIGMRSSSDFVRSTCLSRRWRSRSTRSSISRAIWPTLFSSARAILIPESSRPPSIATWRKMSTVSPASILHAVHGTADPGRCGVTRLLTALALMMTLSLVPATVRAHDAYDDSESHPLRLAAYALHPVGWGLEWLVARPIHFVVS